LYHTPGQEPVTSNTFVTLLVQLPGFINQPPPVKPYSLGRGPGGGLIKVYE